MLRALRIMSIWLLALAIPVQGFAAASMLGCATGHRGAAGGHSHALGMHDHSGSHGDAHKANAGASSKASCSACAACCTSAALPATPVVFEATHMPDSFVLLAPHRVASFIGGGPERPPRSILA